ncbi:MAG: hypothetical protein ACM3SO_22705 [Betaproteobacteria bacterium]
MSVRFRWRTYLRSALSEEAVIDVVRQYLEAWKPEEIARLPASACPGTINSGKDLIRETLKVGQAHSQFTGTRASLALVQEMLLFLTQASVRAMQLTPLPGESVESLQRPVGGKVLSEEERKLFEAPEPKPEHAKPVKDGD